jgi:HAE1 family hydrophobic/amphiphilic exporter-1
MKLTEIAIRHPAFMAMVFAALAVIGLFSYFNMGVDLLPKMEWPGVFISVPYPGAGPKEVETQVSKPIEEALSSLNNMKSLRSYSSENIAFVFIEFNMTADVNEALNEVDRKINQVRSLLPKEVLQPQVIKADLGDLPVLRISVTSNLQDEAFFQFVKDHVKQDLEQIPGVASINITGGKEREIRIEVDNDKLRAYNLSITQVSQALAADNLDFPLGRVEEKNEKNYIVRVAGKYDNLDNVRNMVLASTAAGTIYLKDVATIEDTYKEGYTFSRLNDEPSIGIIIRKASDANSIKVSDKVQAKRGNQKFVLHPLGEAGIRIPESAAGFDGKGLPDKCQPRNIGIMV